MGGGGCLGWGGGLPEGGGGEFYCHHAALVFNVSQDDIQFFLFHFVPALVFMGRKMTIKFLGGVQSGGVQKFYCHLAALVSMCCRTTNFLKISFCAGPCFHGTQDDNKIFRGGVRRGGPMLDQ